MDIGTLRAIKNIAKLIETKYPGTCRDLIEAIDKIEKHPIFISIRAKGIMSKWENIKEWYSQKEDIAEKEKETLFDISDSSRWEDNYRKRWQSHQYGLN